MKKDLNYSFGFNLWVLRYLFLELFVCILRAFWLLNKSHINLAVFSEHKIELCERTEKYEKSSCYCDS